MDWPTWNSGKRSSNCSRRVSVTAAAGGRGCRSARVEFTEALSARGGLHEPQYDIKLATCQLTAARLCMMQRVHERRPIQAHTSPQPRLPASAGPTQSSAPSTLPTPPRQHARPIQQRSTHARTVHALRAPACTALRGVPSDARLVLSTGHGKRHVWRRAAGPGVGNRAETACLGKRLGARMLQRCEPGRWARMMARGGDLGGAGRAPKSTRPADGPSGGARQRPMGRSARQRGGALGMFWGRTRCVQWCTRNSAPCCRKCGPAAARHPLRPNSNPQQTPGRVANFASQRVTFLGLEYVGAPTMSHAAATAAAWREPAPCASSAARTVEARSSK